MMNMNRGYHGWSMSNRAIEAYDNGEMPKSKWTKAAMLAAIAEYFEDNDIEIDDDAAKYLEGLSKPELFGRFFCWSSWHHTSKFANATDFYSVDERELEDFAEHPTRQVYLIKVGLGRHNKEIGTFKTMAKAEKKLESIGFSSARYCWIKGAFLASILIHNEEIGHEK